MKKRKIAGSAVAAAMLVNSLVALPLPVGAVDVKVEFEDGTLVNDATVQTDGKGYSGTGYVFLGNNEGDIPEASVTVDIEEAGDYSLKIAYSAPYGSKQGNVTVNGEGLTTAKFDECEEFTELDLGRVSLKAGENTIAVVGTWGWTNLDYVLVTDYVAPERPEIKATQTNTCDPDAIESTKQVMAYLASIYGKQFLVGQQEIYQYGPHGVETEFEYLEKTTGKLPAIRGFDYGNMCCPCYGTDDGCTDRAIEWAEKGGLVTASFHLNVPKVFEDYEIGSTLAWDATTYGVDTDFSPAKAAEEGTKENQYYTQSLDVLAEQFQKLQEKNITVLWRPLHEAEGNGGENTSWFWWGREGSKAYKELWKFTYDYLTNVKGCHNLIWEWNSYDFSTSANWYPGDQYVDIMGYDKYNCNGGQSHNVSSIADTFYNIMDRFNSAKMVAMFECDSIPTLANIEGDQAGWLYYMPWYDGGEESTNFVSNPNINDPADLKELYNSEMCITLDELPDFGTIEIDPNATNPVENTEPTEPEEGHASIAFDSKNNIYQIDLPESGDVVCLKIELADDAINYANGCLGVSVEVDGEYYWANVQWETTKSGVVEVDLVKNLYNVSLGTDVLDEDDPVIDAVKEQLNQQKSFQGQIWYAGIGEDAADTGLVSIVDAYVKKDSGEDVTDPSEDVTDPSEPSDGKEEGKVTQDATTGDYKIVLPEAADKVYLDVAFDEGVTAVTGGLGCVAEVDGKYYWANIEWKANKEGEVEVDLAKSLRNVTLDDEEVTDEDIIAAVKDAIVKQTEFTGQIWYVGIGAEEGELTQAQIKAAYIKKDGEPSTDATEPGDTLYGDVDGNGEVQMVDMIMLNKYLMIGEEVTPQGLINADVNLDGDVAQDDGLNILRACIELITLPVKSTT